MLLDHLADPRALDDVGADPQDLHVAVLTSPPRESPARSRKIPSTIHRVDSTLPVNSSAKSREGEAPAEPAFARTATRQEPRPPAGAARTGGARPSLTIARCVYWRIWRMTATHPFVPPN